jgi:hypothetical protein
LEAALDSHAAAVAALVKQASSLRSALQRWEKASKQGHIADRQKYADQAGALLPQLLEAAREVAAQWCFDVPEYLHSGAWRAEVIETAAKNHDLQIIEELGTLLSSPVVIRALPAQNSLAFGKIRWPMIKPSVVAAELKRLRDRAAGHNVDELLEALCAAYDHLKPGRHVVKFTDIYDLFCLTPNWKKENPIGAFSQSIYALQRSGAKVTKKNRKMEFIGPSGNVKGKDKLSVIAEDGRTLTYYGVEFR